MVLFSKKSDYWLSPVYYLQARHVMKKTLRLPEPIGERQGVREFGIGDVSMKLAIFGDSAAAGVGVDEQADAPIGQVVANLSENLIKKQQQSLDKLHWQLHATSGHTSFDLLWRLYAMPKQAIDIAIVNIGVNDVIMQTTDSQWQQNLHDICSLLKRKFGVRHLFFMSLPPMEFAPSLPKPLNTLIGRRTQHLSNLMKNYCKIHDINYIKHEFDMTNLDIQAMFAKDGFHASKLTYQLWSQTLAKAIMTVV